jgi:GH35 family endo-1,4-beta-xylanase
MIRLPSLFWLAIMAMFAVASPAIPQAFTGAELSHRSTGSGASDFTLSQNGYVGTYFTLDNDGPVTLTVEASGSTNDAVSPHMNIVIADTKAGFDVASGFTNYEHTYNLPAGTYFVRTEFNNDVPSANRQLTVRSLNIAGATSVSNVTDALTNNANSLAAADTYIENFRKGPNSISVPGLAPGSVVNAKLKRHAFNFGTAVPNSFTDTFLINNPAPGSNAANFQEKLATSRFNSLTPENAGKWDANEGNGSVGSRDSLTSNAVNPNGGPNIPYMDRISDYAEENGMRFRAHNLIWGPNNQQPPWVVAMLNNPNGIDTYNASTNPHGTNLTNRDALFSNLVAPAGTPNAGEKSEIHERIQYYIRDRAQRYYEIDVYNESYHTGSNTPGSNNYWDIFQPSGIASIYKESKDAIAAAGASAKVYINEYNVLQNEGGDSYANWYMRHYETLQNAGRAQYGQDVVDGIGFQYYASSSGSGAHSPSRIYAVMQNLAVHGLPMHLTEFGISPGTTDQNTQANILSDALRLVFGMPDTTGFTMWNFWAGAVWSGAPNGVLYNTDWSIRPAGTAWNALQDQWTTELELEVGPSGTIDFTGFYGDYEVTTVTPGDYNGDGMVDMADYVVWRKLDGQSTPLLNRDTANSGPISAADFDVWRKNFGRSAPAGSGSGASTNIPEPAACVMLLVAALGYAVAPMRSARHTPFAEAARSG